eukprot:gene12228-16378_t
MQSNIEIHEDDTTSSHSDKIVSQDISTEKNEADQYFSQATANTSDSSNHSKSNKLSAMDQPRTDGSTVQKEVWFRNQGWVYRKSNKLQSKKMFLFIQKYFLCFAETPFSKAKEIIDLKKMKCVKEIVHIHFSFLQNKNSSGQFSIELTSNDNEKIEFYVSKLESRKEWFVTIDTIIRFIRLSYEFSTNIATQEITKARAMVSDYVNGVYDFDFNLTLHGRTPIMMAISSGSMEIIELLLSIHVVDVNKPNRLGWSPLHVAVTNGQVEAVRLIIKNPSLKVNKSNSKNNQTALHIAAETYNVDILDLLLNHIDINPTLKNQYGMTAFDIVEENKDHETYPRLYALFAQYKLRIMMTDNTTSPNNNDNNKEQELSAFSYDGMLQRFIGLGIQRNDSLISSPSKSVAKPKSEDLFEIELKNGELDLPHIQTTNQTQLFNIVEENEKEKYEIKINNMDTIEEKKEHDNEDRMSGIVSIGNNIDANVIVSSKVRRSCRIPAEDGSVRSESPNTVTNATNSASSPLTKRISLNMKSLRLSTKFISQAFSSNEHVHEFRTSSNSNHQQYDHLKINRSISSGSSISNHNVDNAQNGEVASDHNNDDEDDDIFLGSRSSSIAYPNAEQLATSKFYYLNSVTIINNEKNGLLNDNNNNNNNDAAALKNINNATDYLINNIPVASDNSLSNKYSPLKRNNNVVPSTIII